MVAIPDFTALMQAYQFGASTNRDRFERWHKLHPTKTMLETIVQDMSPASTAVHSGFSAFNEGGMSVFDFTDFLNRMVSAYVGKQKFLDEAKGAGSISDLEHKKASALVSRHLEALVAQGAETLTQSGATLSFSPFNRLEVSLPTGEFEEEDQVDVFDPNDATTDHMKAEES